MASSRARHRELLSCFDDAAAAKQIGLASRLPVRFSCRVAPFANLLQRPSLFPLEQIPRQVLTSDPTVSSLELMLTIDLLKFDAREGAVDG